MPLQSAAAGIGRRHRIRAGRRESTYRRDRVSEKEIGGHQDAVPPSGRVAAPYCPATVSSAAARARAVSLASMAFWTPWAPGSFDWPMTLSASRSVRPVEDLGVEVQAGAQASAVKKATEVSERMTGVTMDVTT